MPIFGQKAPPAEIGRPVVAWRIEDTLDPVDDR
jgi:hypothetical protein